MCLRSKWQIAMMTYLAVEECFSHLPFFQQLLGIVVLVLSVCACVMVKLHLKEKKRGEKGGE